MTTTSTTAKLEALIAEGQQASHDRREAEQAAGTAAGRVAQLRGAAVEAHASDPKGVEKAKKAYHQAEIELDEAKMAAEGAGLKAERAHAAVEEFMRANAEALIEELRPEADENTAERAKAIATLVELEDQKTEIAARVARYVTAAGHSVQGNVPAEDALAQYAAVLRDVASGLRPLQSPMPTWEHRDRVEEHHRRQAEQAERQGQDQHDRAGVGI